MDKIAGEYPPVGRVTIINDNPWVGSQSTYPVYPSDELVEAINKLEERVAELEKQVYDRNKEK